MLLHEPPPSQGDLHFRVFGIPVRVHPMFWVITGIMGLDTRDGTPPAEFVTWIAVVFVSILVHEMGHAFVQRRFGGHPWITLHGLGGLASCDDCDRRPRSQILISLAGPAAGFALAAVVVAAVQFSGHKLGWMWGSELDWERIDMTRAHVLPLVGGLLYWEPFATRAANTILADLLQVNILWGLINLLPVYPLDGGRVSRELCMLGNPRQGVILSLQISLVAAALMALVALVAWGSLFTAALFGYLAFTSLQTLRAYQARSW